MPHALDSCLHAGLIDPVEDDLFEVHPIAQMHSARHLSGDIKQRTQAFLELLGQAIDLVHAMHRHHDLVEERIDHILATDSMASRCTGFRIDRDERKGKKPSDHAPVIAEFA